MENIYATIIGGGVVGTALAQELSKRTDREVVVLERHKKDKIENQSTRNSGVIHAGVYYPQDKAPLKAKLCVEGNRMLYRFCAEYGVPHQAVGKLVVATNPREEEYLEDVVRISRENGVPNFRLIDGVEAKTMEPNIICTKAAYFPTSGIIDAVRYMSTLRALAKENGTEFLFGTKVADINPKKSGFEVTTLTEGAQGGYSTFETELLFNCAGLYSDEIAGMVNPENGWEIFPARGEAANFYNTRREELQAGRMNVYPAPFGFFNETGEKAEVSFSEFEKLLNEGKVSKMVGVHLSPTFDETGKVGKTVMVGPGISIGFGKENYKHHHPLDFYVKEVNGFLPQLKEEDLNFHQVGIQAKTKTHYDWVIQRDEKHPNCVQLVGIDSPGLTGSLAIAGYVLDDLLEMEK